ncbi:ArsR/SmtB family transcription factor [Sandaracinus amylolyticus]|uniref:Transcriptional regulator, ArsR family protein n=1 Tax=Sandaracinus amylolyticus TaxID=927083 RepID=A0A0F6SI94_9BACT|nr:metalloregulator ArsR/SmtB family transcription factor [Sandaracinus amylolyticus]AKF11799.1 Transcriptional regulator, ArsR family protein [Sandaracinus amylolyticus]
MDVGTVIAAIADPTRRAILESVRHGPRSVGDIATDFDVSRPAVSQHLRVLVDAQLVRPQRSGRHNFYGLDLRGLTLLRGYIEGYWDDVLTAFQNAAIAESEAASRAPTPRAPKRR